jgi:hypothetical protein
VQNSLGKEVGQGGQGVDIVGHPRRGGRQPVVSDRGLPRRATAGRSSGHQPLPAAGGNRRSAADRGSQPVCTDRLRLWKLRPVHIF